eukprot:scaffold509974_cov52-Prasinocladus_malaysianus.AAC.1
MTEVDTRYGQAVASFLSKANEALLLLQAVTQTRFAVASRLGIGSRSKNPRPNESRVLHFPVFIRAQSTVALLSVKGIRTTFFDEQNRTRTYVSAISSYPPYVTHITSTSTRTHLLRN